MMSGGVNYQRDKLPIIFEEDEACTSPADVFGRTLAKGGIVTADESAAAVERERRESRG